MAKRLPWRVDYIDENGKKDSLWFGALVDEKEKDIRLSKLEEIGWHVLDCYHVNTL